MIIGPMAGKLEVTNTMDLVISPTLNEVDNIDALVEGVLSLEGFSLLIVDDNSGDGTWRKVEELAEGRTDLYLLRRLSNPGFRNSYIDGFRWALSQSGIRYLFTMDADLSHRPQYLPQIREALEAGADMVVGSRYTYGGGVENWSFWRSFLSRNANRFARFVTRLPVRDCTAGFNGMRAEILRKLNLEEIECGGYGFLVELKHLVWRNGAKLAEVPIVFREREHGETKFNSGMINEAVSTCLRLRKLNKQKIRLQNDNKSDENQSSE